MFVSFIFTFLISIISEMIRGKWNKDLKNNKEIKSSESSESSERSERSKRSENSIKNRKYKLNKMVILDMKDNMNNKFINNIKYSMKKIMEMSIFKWIIKLIGYILIMLGIGIRSGSFNSIYCKGTDYGDNSNSNSKRNSNSNSNNNYNNNNNNNNNDNDKNNDRDNNKVKGKEKDKNENDNKTFNVSGNVSKGMIKEAVEGIVAGINSVVPPVIGGIAGVSLGKAAIKASSGLPPVQKAALGVATTVITTYGVTDASGLGKEVGSSKNKGIEISVSGPKISSSTKISSTEVNEESVKNFSVPSMLDKELSPLELILNYEIILSVCILFHIGLLFLIWLHKLYVSSGFNIISKLFSTKIVAKYEKFKKMIENIGTTYLIILVIINVILIIFYVFVLIYANVELSNNIDAYIDVHLDMKKIVMMLLFVKSNLILNKNIINKFKYFSVSSTLHKKI